VNGHITRPLRFEFAGMRHLLTTFGNARQDIISGNENRVRFVTIDGKNLLPRLQG
jgi:hypothetical protein